MSDPGIIVPDTAQGDLVINSVSLTRPGGELEVAWTTLDLSSLYGYPNTIGGSTRIPQTTGRIPNPLYVDETVYRIPMHITGARDPDGDPHTNPVMGLVTNLDFLWEHVVSPAVGITRSAELTMPDDSVRVAEVQVQIVLGVLLGPYDKMAELFLTVPAGRFEESGS